MSDMDFSDLTYEDLYDWYEMHCNDKESVYKLSDIKRPLILVRGRPITVEQAKVLISGEEPLFIPEAKANKGCDNRGYAGVLGDIFYRSDKSWLYGWICWDGTIGGNLTSGDKYPEFEEMVSPYMHLARKYPFLDMVIAFTTYDECTCYTCEFGPVKIHNSCGCSDCFSYLEQIRKYDDWLATWSGVTDFDKLYFSSWGNDHVRSDVGNRVEMVLWIHGGKTDIFFGEKARDVFNEYNSLYSAPEYDFMFGGFLYSQDSTCKCDKKFVEDCFELVGMPRSTCDEYIKRGFIQPFNENATVVTKNWVIEQYNKYIHVD